MGRLPVIQIPAGDDGLKKVGRDHNTYGFNMWLAGDGIRGGDVHGKTDEFSHRTVEGIVTHHDYLATILHLFGLAASAMKFRSGTPDLALVTSN